MVSLIISIIICFVMFNYFSILFFPSLLLFFSIFLAAFAPLKLCAAPATHRHKVVFISASMKARVIFPGKVKVSFRRGPTGYLRQDPSVEAKRIKDHPDLQDKSAAQNEDRVKDNARSVVFMRGGDISDKQEVLGEYVLQFGKYKGKLFRWLAENDVGYVIYLIKKVREEERAGQFKPDGPKKNSLLSLLQYSYSFQEIKDLLLYLDSQVVTPPAKDDEDNLVGFGVHTKRTWRDVWKRRDDGFSAFILRQQCTPGSKMFRLQDYLKRQSASEGRASHWACNIGLSLPRCVDNTSDHI
jgi:hypothetical protein